LELMHVGELNGGKLLEPIVEKNGFRPLGKPNGKHILWCSPLNSVYGWIDWCKEEMPSWAEGKLIWKIVLNGSQKLYKINNYEDLADLAGKFPFAQDDTVVREFIFWQDVAREYDGIWLTPEGAEFTRFSLPLTLYGWDCETVVLFKCREIIARVESFVGKTR